MKHQMYGDLDEAKLIEGLTGEKGIYKRRADKEPEVWIFERSVIETIDELSLYFNIIIFIK